MIRDLYNQFHFDSRESDLASNGYYILAQELIYQWLGSWITPSWWSDAHINKAIVGFLAASTSLEVSVINLVLLFRIVELF